MAKDIFRNLVLLFKNKLYLKKFFMHKNEPININKISETVDKLCVCLNIKNNYKITKIGNEIIKINLKNV